MNTNKPFAVTWFDRTAVAYLTFGLLGAALSLPLVEQRVVDSGLSPHDAAAVLKFTVSAMAFGTVMNAALWLFISRMRWNWARVVYCLFAVQSVYTIVAPPADFYQNSIFAIGFSLSAFLAHGVSAALIWLPESTAWLCQKQEALRQPSYSTFANEPCTREYDEFTNSEISTGRSGQTSATIKHTNVSIHNPANTTGFGRKGL